MDKLKKFELAIVFTNRSVLKSDSRGKYRTKNSWSNKFVSFNQVFIILSTKRCSVIVQRSWFKVENELAKCMCLKGLSQKAGKTKHLFLIF